MRRLLRRWSQALTETCGGRTVQWSWTGAGDVHTDYKEKLSTTKTVRLWSRYPKMLYSLRPWRLQRPVWIKPWAEVQKWLLGQEAGLETFSSSLWGSVFFVGAVHYKLIETVTTACRNHIQWLPRKSMRTGGSRPFFAAPLRVSRNYAFKPWCSYRWPGRVWISDPQILFCKAGTPTKKKQKAFRDFFYPAPHHRKPLYPPFHLHSLFSLHALNSVVSHREVQLGLVDTTVFLSTVDMLYCSIWNCGPFKNAVITGSHLRSDPVLQKVFLQP